MLLGKHVKSSMKYFRKPLCIGGGVLLLGLVLAPTSEGQLGIDTAAILAGLSAVNSTMQSAMQIPMQALQARQQAQSAFEQNTVWPATQISQAWQSAARLGGMLQTSQSLMSTSVQSAQLPQNRTFEQHIFSGDVSNIDSVGSDYAATYGQPMSSPNYSQQLPAATIVALDANDAAAQQCLKKAIELDAMAQQESDVAQSLSNQLQTAAPGVAPVISAQASTWLVQGEAVTQGAIAQLLRAQAADVAYRSFELKAAGSNTQNSNTALQGLGQAMGGTSAGTTADPAAVRVKH
jgi:hypothetical protein